MGIEWKFTRSGRAWEGNELTERHALLPEPTRIEVHQGKLFWNDEERLTVFAMLLENLGIDKIVPLIDRELYLDGLMGNAMANPHALGLSKNRFWSSGDELPIKRIIARVLTEPTEDDLVILKKHFGVGPILETWQKLIDRGEIAQSVIPITKKMLRKLVDLS